MHSFIPGRTDVTQLFSGLSKVISKTQSPVYGNAEEGREKKSKTRHFFLPSPGVRDVGSIIFWKRFENTNDFWNAASK